jgi:hypothetical protein
LPDGTSGLTDGQSSRMWFRKLGLLERLCLYSILETVLLGSIWLTQTGASSMLFYMAFCAIAVLLGVSFISNAARSEQIFLVCITALILRLIVPLSKPSSVVDIYPDAYQLRGDVISIINGGRVPTVTPVWGSYLSYPGASILLTSINLLAGVPVDPLVKYLPVMIFLPIFSAIPTIVRALGVHGRRSETLAVAIVAFIPLMIAFNAYPAPFNFGTILFILALGFFFDAVARSSRRSFALFILVASSLVICSVTAAFFLMVVIGGYIIVMTTVRDRQRFKIRLGVIPFAFVLSAFLIWYVLLSGSDMMRAFIFILTSAIPREISPSAGLATPAAIKPLWMIGVEYVAFGFSGLIILSSLLNKSEQSHVAKRVAYAGLLVSFSYILPWALGMQFFHDLGRRVLLILGVMCAPAMAASLESQHGSRPFDRKAIATGIMITLLVLNSVFYDMPLFYYDHSIPEQSEDTRKIEFWKTAGDFFYGRLTGSMVWGPRLGATFVGIYDEVAYTPFVIPVTTSPKAVLVEASSFANLPTYPILRGQYVLIPKDMDVVLEGPRYLPDIATPLTTSDRIYDNGRIVLLIAFAPAK